MTGQADVRLCKLGAVDGLLNKCIRRYFFPSRAKEAKTQKKKLKNKITPGLRLGDTKKEKVQDSIFDNIFFFHSNASKSTYE